MGYHKWLTYAGVVAAGSADAAVEGRHYYRNMRINKESFCALEQHKGETLTSKYQEMNFEKSLYRSYARPRPRKNRR